MAAKSKRGSKRTSTEELDEEWVDEEEEDWEEEWDEEDEDWEPAPKSISKRRNKKKASDGPALDPRVPAIAALALVPLFAAYEWGLFESGGAPRNYTERLLSAILRPAGEYEAPLRCALLAALACGAWIWARRGGGRPAPALLRTLFEGFAAAMLLGPLMLWTLALFSSHVGVLDLPDGPPDRLPGLVGTALLFGSAAWEELLFRVCVYSLLYLWAGRVLAFFGLGETACTWCAEAVGLFGSAFFFAVFHLNLSGAGWEMQGEAFAMDRFLWRFLAGAMLGALYRWRGVGVSAWAHGAFNVAMTLGAGPGVFGLA